MIQDEPRDWPMLPEAPWRPPPYSWMDLGLILFALAILIPLISHAIQAILVAFRGS